MQNPVYVDRILPAYVLYLINSNQYHVHLSLQTNFALLTHIEFIHSLIK